MPETRDGVDNMKSAIRTLLGIITVVTVAGCNDPEPQACPTCPAPVQPSSLIWTDVPDDPIGIQVGERETLTVRLSPEIDAEYCFGTTATNIAVTSSVAGTGVVEVTVVALDVGEATVNHLRGRRSGPVGRRGGVAPGYGRAGARTGVRLDLDHPGVGEPLGRLGALYEGALRLLVDLAHLHDLSRGTAASGREPVQRTATVRTRTFGAGGAPSGFQKAIPDD